MPLQKRRLLLLGEKGEVEKVVTRRNLQRRPRRSQRQHRQVRLCGRRKLMRFLLVQFIDRAVDVPVVMQRHVPAVHAAQ